MADRPPPTVVPRASRRARLPSFVRLPMLIILNICLQSALWTGAENVLSHELGAVSKVPRPGQEQEGFGELTEPIVRLVSKIALVSVAWKLRYDYFDIGALTAVINIPFAFLLTTFYNISLLTAAAHVAIEVISIALPTYLLRPIADINNPAVPIRNRYLLNSFQVSWSNTALAVGVYATVLYSSLQTNWLTIFLINHFDLPSVELAHDVQAATFIPKLLVAGYATKAFLLDPAIGAQPETGAVTPVGPFEPATATLPQTLKHNFWFFSRRTRTLIQRSAVLSTFLLANTVLRGATLEGSEIAGSAGYAGVWILAANICAAWFVWTGDADP
ncbi:uncharacterized protein CC84DRAFT_1092114 [Paraphaeosphaeria sporulosa]|uniref:Uncharacterized protein n=1 Tax=Paraphaeosphaeria sporulosa TaxID=1460663 RepID=A0A177CG34_9PLEO|nr:uncharacterized protein CC84DRAFT_1092114 [Paraphaeosphaeria sporulosa]OAG06296.1 hypothetical protein CC84DRAFT_1092114 [Paraphaeosphaeria sporulosa]